MESEFIERLYNEFHDLEVRLLKLEMFLESEKIDDLSKIQFSYLRIQKDIMRAYHKVLNDRIVDLKEQL